MKTLEGMVAGLYIGQDAGSIQTTKLPEVPVTFEGFVGDRHAGLTILSGGRTPYYPKGTEIRNSRQVAIVSIEELEEIAIAMGVPVIQPEWMGTNLALRGIPHLTLLPPATRIFFPGDATLVIESENLPCTSSGKMIQVCYPKIPDLANHFPRAAIHKRGVVAWVERPGIIREGDIVKLLLPGTDIYG